MLDKLYRPVYGIRSKDRRATQGWGEDFVIMTWPNRGKKMYKDVVWRPYHLGIDYAGPNAWDKISVFSAHSGTVRILEDPKGFWNCVIIDGGDYETYYGHLGEIQVKDWQRVNPNIQIWVMGSSGNSTAVHLHFGLRMKDRAQGRKGRVDPSKYISDRVMPPVHAAPISFTDERFKTLTASDVAALKNLIEKEIRNWDIGELDKRMLIIVARAIYKPI